ncbi:MAG: MBL fold metallo-hydrolase [Deltaproteobacteria bacterium]|nr:MBL fold metallo-hydrolase [Deltaproteobacteria bacterium]
MRITVLASGSKGNVSLFEHGTSRVLVDAGLSVRELKVRLARACVQGAPTAQVITHAHRDHWANAEAVARHFGIPVFVSEATRRVIPLTGVSCVCVYSARQAFGIGDLELRPQPLPHDAAQVALRISSRGHAALLATDLGEVTPQLQDLVKGCEAVLIESNHDTEMLWRGPYPPSLKKRVASAQGHLSNHQTRGFLKALPREVQTVVLMHLSETNNSPGLALECAAEALSEHPARLLVASQTGVTQLATRGPKQLSLFGP